MFTLESLGESSDRIGHVSCLRSMRLVERKLGHHIVRVQQRWNSQQTGSC